LGAPAEPSEPFSAARPDWYFLFLFQFLKFFPGGTELWGAVIIPGLIMGLIFIMPFLGRWRLGHMFNLGLLGCLLLGAAMLTYLATAQDRKDQNYRVALKAAEQDAARVRVLAKAPFGIPTSGAVTLLRNDPLTQGPKLFAAKCASCHRYDGHDGTGIIPKDPQTASDLKGFASREWITGLLDPDKVAGTNYFGATSHADGKMVKFVRRDIAKYSPEQKEQLRKVIAAVSAEAQLQAQLAADQRDAAIIAEGRNLLASETRCTDCHQFHKKDEDATAPDLTGYGSRNWLISFLSDPAHESFYGKRNDRMPAFGKDQILTPEAIALLADWLRATWYEPAQASSGLIDE
jgi:ubiquinol-cytochrome c reductase cytochrome b subunit